MTGSCACGCGAPLPTDSMPYGGYNSRIRERVWFASNRCAARFENAVIAYRREHPEVVPVPLEGVQHLVAATR